MAKHQEKARAYKAVTLQQLRSFYETARLGSLMAAAEFLDLAHPTVWQQVHSLERELGEKLVETHRHGCRLTAAGRLLAELAGPSLLLLISLKERFQESRSLLQDRLTVAATPRIMVEELPECVVEFERRLPRVQLALRELRDEEIVGAVESGEADLGLTPVLSSDRAQPWRVSPWLVCQPCYELDHILVVPKDHPLARLKLVRPRDLRDHPMVNSPLAFLNPAVTAVLDQAGALKPPTGRSVQASFAATVCRYVELGFGIALIGGLPGRRTHPKLHERVMSDYFGRATIYLVRRKGAPQTQAALTFADTVDRLLNKARPARGRKPRSSPKPST